MGSDAYFSKQHSFFMSLWPILVCCSFLNEEVDTVCTVQEVVRLPLHRRVNGVVWGEPTALFIFFLPRNDKASFLSSEERSIQLVYSYSN